MEINVVSLIPFGIDATFEAMRDHMPELAAYMPNVDSIVVESRDAGDDEIVRLVNRWNAAATEIPAVARTFVDQSNVYWLDHAEWTTSSRSCNWRLEMGFMADRIKCTGCTSYHVVSDDQTEMRIKGELSLNLKGMVPRLLLGKVTSGVEKFVGKLVQPNFEKTSNALTAYLDANHGN
jgi:hypothetical protein